MSYDYSLGIFYATIGKCIYLGENDWERESRVHISHDRFVGGNHGRDRTTDPDWTVSYLGGCD